ncbi:MAG: hypothetical protein FWD71_01375 [Oscillospiraceae bacterium]|nr:hypothetical protein [Oscillospiraceae bacterium]
MKRINGGEFRTMIIIKKPIVKTSDSGFAKRDKTDTENIFGEGINSSETSLFIPCKWDDKPYNRSYKLSGLVDGAEASRDYIYALINHTNKVDYDCDIWKVGEDIPYNIINITNIEERSRYLELQLRRVVQID